MTTSGVTTFNETALEIITDALIDIGVYAPGETIPANEYNDCLRKLNSLVKVLAIQNHLWTTKDVTVTLTPGKQSYTVGTGLEINTPRPLRVKAARRQNDSGVEIEVQVVSRDEYIMLPIKDTQAPVLQVYYDPQLANGVLYCWPTGSSGDTTLILTVQRPLEDFTSSTNNPDFPQEWLLPLSKALAVKIAPGYLGTIPPDLKQESLELLDDVSNFDEEPVSFHVEFKRR